MLFCFGKVWKPVSWWVFDPMQNVLGGWGVESEVECVCVCPPVCYCFWGYVTYCWYGTSISKEESRHQCISTVCIYVVHFLSVFFTFVSHNVFAGSMWHVLYDFKCDRSTQLSVCVWVPIMNIICSMDDHWLCIVSQYSHVWSVVVHVCCVLNYDSIVLMCAVSSVSSPYRSGGGVSIRAPAWRWAAAQCRWCDPHCEQTGDRMVPWHHNLRSHRSLPRQLCQGKVQSTVFIWLGSVKKSEFVYEKYIHTKVCCFLNLSSKTPYTLPSTDYPIHSSPLISSHPLVLWYSCDWLSQFIDKSGLIGT